jgi:hypothetical protein
MRFVVLLFGFLAVTLTGFMGVMFIFTDILDALITENGIDKIVKDAIGIDVSEILSASPLGIPHSHTGLILVLAAVYGLLGTLLVFGRCGWQGALLMLVPVICAAIMNPYTAVFTGLLAFTGLLSFLVFPLPIAAPQPAEDD